MKRGKRTFPSENLNTDSNQDIEASVYDRRLKVGRLLRNTEDSTEKSHSETYPESNKYGSMESLFHLDFSTVDHQQNSLFNEGRVSSVVTARHTPNAIFSPDQFNSTVRSSSTNTTARKDLSTGQTDESVDAYLSYPSVESVKQHQPVSAANSQNSFAEVASDYLPNNVNVPSCSKSALKYTFQDETYFRIFPFCKSHVSDYKLVDKTDDKGTTETVKEPTKCTETLPSILPSNNSDKMEDSSTVSLLSDKAHINGILDDQILRTLNLVSRNIPINSFEVVKCQNAFRKNDLKGTFLYDFPSLEAISIGLASYLSDKKLENIKVCTLYFKESLIKSPVSKEIDIYIRYWNETTAKVDMQYLTSLFFTLDTSNIVILQGIQKYLKELKDKKIKVIQKCVDAPKISPINSFVEDKANVCDNLILRSFNRAFVEAFECDDGNFEWYLGDLNYLLHGLCHFFQESSSRTERFIKLSKNKKLPSTFSHKLSEKIIAVKKALEIWDDIKRFIIEDIQSCCSSYFPIVKEACEDCLVPVKLQFFVFISELVENFTAKFQRQSSFLPYYVMHLQEFVVDMLKNFNIVKDDRSVEKVDDLFNFLEANIKPNSTAIDIDLGFKAEILLRALMDDGEITKIQVVLLRVESRVFLLKLLLKILEESGITSPIAISSSCFVPSYMAEDPAGCITKLSDILGAFVLSNVIPIEDCQEIQLQYKNILEYIKLSNPFSEIGKFKDSKYDKYQLDVFFHNFLSKPKYSKLWYFVKLILILFNCVGDTDINTLNETNILEKNVTDLEQYQKCHCAKKIILDYINNASNDSKDGISISEDMRRGVFKAIATISDLSNVKKKHKLQD